MSDFLLSLARRAAGVAAEAAPAPELPAEFKPEGELVEEEGEVTAAPTAGRPSEAREVEPAEVPRPVLPAGTVGPGARLVPWIAETAQPPVPAAAPPEVRTEHELVREERVREIGTPTTPRVEIRERETVREVVREMQVVRTMESLPPAPAAVPPVRETVLARPPVVVVERKDSPAAAVTPAREGGRSRLSGLTRPEIFIQPAPAAARETVREIVVELPAPPPPATEVKAPAPAPAGPARVRSVPPAAKAIPQRDKPRAEERATPPAVAAPLKPAPPPEPVRLPSPETAGTEPQEVKVNIGTIEIRAAAPAPPVRPVERPAPPPEPLEGFDAYRGLRTYGGWYRD